MNTQEVLRLIADQIDAGQDPLELWQIKEGDGWVKAANQPTLLTCSLSECMRLKPKTHMVHGVECPAPMSEAPDILDTRWGVNTIVKEGVSSCAYTDHYALALSRGMLFATEADALANAKARYPELFTGEDDE